MKKMAAHMSSPYQLISHAQKLLVLMILCSSFISIAAARAFVAQITYAGSTLSPLYLASNLSIGTPPQSEKLLISTDTISHSWIECGSGAAFDPRRSSSFQYLRCGRNPCYEVLKPYSAQLGRLARDTFSLHSTNGSSQGSFVAVRKVAFACANAKSGPAQSGFSGVAALTASKRGLPAQLGVTKFAYCLPSSPTDGPTPLFLGDGIDYFFTTSPISMNISAFLAMTAKLDVDQKTGLLSVGLNNVTIEEEAVTLRAPLRLQVSSVEPFTKISRGLYVKMRALFRVKAAARGIQQVAAQAPFDTCFNASTIGFSRVGPAVPPMELELRGAGGEDVAWSVFGFNSVVAVSDSVSCWAFLDAGVGKPSVLGSFQQQGGLFEFDLRNQRLGFSGVLDFYRTTCSNFIF